MYAKLCDTSITLTVRQGILQHCPSYYLFPVMWATLPLHLWDITVGRYGAWRAQRDAVCQHSWWYPMDYFLQDSTPSIMDKNGQFWKSARYFGSVFIISLRSCKVRAQPMKRFAWNMGSWSLSVVCKLYKMHVCTNTNCIGVNCIWMECKLIMMLFQSKLQMYSHISWFVIVLSCTLNIWYGVDDRHHDKCTVYPKKYAHGFVVLCFVVVMQSFIMNSHEVFIHIHQGCFAGTGAIVRLPQCQWS